MSHIVTSNKGTKESGNCRVNASTVWQLTDSRTIQIWFLQPMNTIYFTIPSNITDIFKLIFRAPHSDQTAKTRHDPGRNSPLDDNNPNVPFH